MPPPDLRTPWTLALLLAGALVTGPARSAPRAPLEAPALVLTSDLEGDLGRLEQTLRAHPLLAPPRPDGRLPPGVALVHGGDLPDRGGASRALAQRLWDLHQRNPGQVLLVAGNRDLNKLRLPGELSPRALRALPGHRPEAWRAYCTRHGLDPLAASRDHRLRWILAETMGAGDAFENRRRELARRDGRDPEAVSDPEVTEDFLASLTPTGPLRRLLGAARLMHRVGNTLFVHGALPAAGIGLVPASATTPAHRVADLNAWPAALEAWYLDQLAAFDGPGHPAAQLVDLSRPSPLGDRGMVYTRPVEASGLPRLPPPSVRAALRAVGIQRLVVGHTPVGQVPLVLRTDEADFELVMTDTSRAPPGAPAPMTWVDGGDQRGLHLRGQVDGRPVRADLELGTPSWVGQRLRDDSIVVGETEGGFVVYSIEPGFRVRYRVLDRLQVRARRALARHTASR